MTKKKKTRIEQIDNGELEQVESPGFDGKMDNQVDLEDQIKEMEPFQTNVIENPEVKQSMKRYRIQFDFEYKGSPGKEMTGKSMTQPDMSLTIRQLLQNHSRGIDNTEHEHQPLYFDIGVPQITDITDVHEYRDNLEAKLRMTEEFIKEDQLKKQQDEQRGETSTDQTPGDPIEQGIR